MPKAILIVVVICFHFSNFEPLETAWLGKRGITKELWFAFILVTLSHWKQLYYTFFYCVYVVICFHFSNFEPLETAGFHDTTPLCKLWFAFILVTLSHWKQRHLLNTLPLPVVICFHFSNFEPLETACVSKIYTHSMLWFAFILVTLSHWKQQSSSPPIIRRGCDLLSF